eukprot:CAMPEP_0197657178 /NCGR_PEP_ID=MMETSP1338-20131121/44466_1 /TAXON_ID=43686 ORGANISM="Pelagodinium beii, Strain RCC1491" /NCGR_SAMPLE_ID=MMETSP1338 /ASSEMBLY_ACC=CAM_ASM_000754 /LENGTH=676 /DNA_ID=CAMNT_0043233491 /DNA_START=72 /DNA_END=2102 /DNA_ORIENTATION=-
MGRLQRLNGVASCILSCSCIFTSLASASPREGFQVRQEVHAAPKLASVQRPLQQPHPPPHQHQQQQDIPARPNRHLWHQKANQQQVLQNQHQQASIIRNEQQHSHATISALSQRQKYHHDETGHARPAFAHPPPVALLKDGPVHFAEHQPKQRQKDEMAHPTALNPTHEDGWELLPPRAFAQPSEVSVIDVAVGAEGFGWDESSPDLHTHDDSSSWTKIQSMTPIPDGAKMNILLDSEDVVDSGSALHPMKGGNANHSGFSPFRGPPDLSTTAWSFHIPDSVPTGFITSAMSVFHGSPMMDSAMNIYIQSTSGFIYSLDKWGSLRWTFQMVGRDPQNPGNLALLNGVAYTCTDDGTAWAIDMNTGQEKWRRRIAKHCSWDTFSTAAAEDTVIFPCNPGLDPENLDGSTGLCAVGASDGSAKWMYNLAQHNSKGYSMAPAIVGDSVYFSDVAGAAYSISLQDGKERWYTQGPPNPHLTTGSLVVGPNGKAYNGFSVGTSSNITGIVRAHSLDGGKVLWTKTFIEGINVAPAVGPYGRKTAVVVAVGNNLECNHIPSITSRKRGQIYVLDGETGREIWHFDLPYYSVSTAGNIPRRTCCPDVMGQPTLASDGTVYVNWSGGKQFALKDVNKDGKVDANSKKEFAYFHHGKGSNAQSALAAGFLVSSVCDRLIAFGAAE